MEGVRIFFSNEMSIIFDKLKEREKNYFLKLVSMIVMSNGTYQKETIKGKNQTFYSSPRGHVDKRVLWFKKSDNEYYFLNYFLLHKDYDKYVDKIKIMNIIINYKEVPSDLI